MNKKRLENIRKAIETPPKMRYWVSCRENDDILYPMALCPDTGEVCHVDRLSDGYNTVILICEDGLPHAETTPTKPH